MPNEFAIPDEDILNNNSFKLLKYLDPYGDTTFNAFMFEDLINDLTELKKLLPADSEQIDTVIGYAQVCIDDNHTYLKFYGD